MTSISSGSGPVTGPHGEPTGSSTSTAADRTRESAPVAARDGAGDAAALARTEAARPEAPGSGMTEGPRLELQQWASRLSDLTRELDALPAGSAEANARLAEIRQHLTRLAALQSRVEDGLRSGPAALAQDYLLLLNSSRSALTFLNAHRSDPGSGAFGAEATLIGALQSRRDRSLASLRTLAVERLLPSLSIAEGAEPSEQQVGDYRLLLRINGALGEAELETVRLSRELTTAYATHTHPDTIAAGGELPEYLRSSFFRELDPNPARTGEAPAAHSPDAAFPEGHPMRELYRTLWEHRGEAFSESDANRLIQQLQSLRGELAEGGRYGNFVSGSNRGNLTASLENLERLLRNAPRRVSEEDVLNMERPLHLLGTLEYQAQLQSSAGTTTRGRITLYWRMYEEYRRLGNGEAARGCLYNIYQASQMNLLPENRTNGLSEADRQAVLVRFLEAYVGTGRLDVNFASMMNSLGREIRHLWEHGTEESRFTALSLWTRYNGLHRWIDANYTEGTMDFLLLEPPHRLLGTTAEALPALLQDMENRARASEDPNAGAARLIMVAQAYASGGDMGTCAAILRGVEGSIAAHPANEGNPFASRALILGAFSGAGMSDLLGDYVDDWIAADRAALREARPRDRAHLLSETLQDWASLMSGLSEIGRPEMASRVFAALDAEMAPLTPESRARVYREILPHMHGAQREEILNRVRDLIGSDAERSEPLSIDARVQLNAILGEFSADPFEIQGAFSALTSIVRHERPSAEMLVEIHRYRLALRNHIHDLVRAHPDRLIEGSDIREMWLWVDGYGGRDGGSNAIVDALTEARRALLNRLSGAAGPGERRRILTLLGDSFREGMRMRLHGNDYGLQAFVDQHLEMIRALRPAERPSVFAESLQFLNQMEVERMRARGREVDSFRNVYYDTMTAALPSLIADIPAGPERRSAILQFTRALSQAREAEERRLRAAERALVAIRATSAHHWAVEHGFDERFLCRTEAEDVDALRPAVEAMRRMETGLWNQFAEGESIPEARRVYEGFARAMSLTVEGRSGEARAAMTAYYSDPEVQAFLRSDPAGDAHRAEAQAQIQQLLDVSATILNGEAGARFDRTLRIVRGLARIRLHTLRAEGEEYPYDIGTIDRMTMELPRFLATLPPDRMPQTFEAALQLFGAANEGNARLLSEYNGAINRIPVQRVGEDGAARTGSVWGLIRAMEHIGDPGGAERAFAALQQVVADDTDWDLLSMEGRGDLGPALQDFCDIILEEGTNVSPGLRQRVADFRARIPEEEEWGHFLRQTFNWQLAVDIGLMALSGGIGGMARAAVSRIVIGLAERAALRMASTTAIRMTMMAGRGIAYVGGHVASGVTFNLIHASTSALILNRPMENPFASGLRMSADSMINDPISMMLFSSVPGPSSMVGRFLYRQVATAITFQISQNIRYHAERGARDLLDSDFHRAVERREHMRAMWEATGDHYYMERFEAAERSVTEIIGHEPDNSVRGIMLNIGMNIGQAGADHVMGTHHWAGHFGLEEAPRAAAERPGAPRSEAERTARREHHVSLADALASTRATRHGSGREAAGGPYRGGAEEGPAREAAARRAGEERAFFRELVDLDVYENYTPEALDGIVDHVARRFDPRGEPPALNESARRFLRFFFTHVNPEHAGRVAPEALATLLEAAVSGTRPAERTRAAERPAEGREPGVETAPVEVPAERIPGLTRGVGDAPLAERALRASPDLSETIRDREASPEAELGFRLLADEGLADTLAHLDDLLRGADPEALRTAEGRERFLRGYREAREHLEANPDALGGLRPHEALAALMAREGGDDLPTAARRLVAGEIRLRPRTEAEHGLVPPGAHAASPVRRVVAEELTARHQETSLREAARAVEHARREVRELTALLRAREGDPRFAAIEAQNRDVRVRLEAAHRRVAEVRERIRELRRAERELSRRGLDPERRRELGVEANRLRRDIAQRIAGIRNAEAGVTRFVAAVRALERATPRPATEAAARETVRVDVSEEGAVTGRGAESEAPRRGERTANEGPEIEIVDEGIRVDLSEAAETAAGPRAEGAEELTTHLTDPAASARGAAARMSSGLMAVLGLGTAGLTTLTPSTAHAQDAAASGGHGLIADSAQFLSSFLHLSPLAMTGTAATIALGFGAVYAIFRRAARARAAERAPTAVRESAAARGRAGEAARGEADGGGQGRQQGDSGREGSAPELPARMEQAPDIALAAPEAPRTPAVETSFEGVLQDNAPGAPRRGAIAVREASPDYGTAAGATHEGVGYKDSNEDALVHGVDATGARYAVVLDGMGGMGRGDQASRLAGEVIQAEMSAHGDLMRAFGAAHEAVRRRYPGAGACAVAHRVFRGSDGRMRMEIVHVGDSGAVVFGRDGRVIHRTRDQSQVQMLADAGLIEGGELAMRTHPDVNVVQGGLGPSRVLPPVRHEIALEGGERAVMFSDGLGDNVSTEEIVRRVSESGSAEEAQNGLMGLALQRMGILDSLYAQFDDLPEGARVPFTAPDGRTLYLARDLPVSQLQGGVVEMMNVYDAAEGGNLVDHFKPDNVAVHVYFHDPAAPAAARADEAAIVTAPPGEDFGAPPPAPRLGEAPSDAEVYVPTQVPAEGAPPPVDLAPPPPPRLGLAADAAEARTIDLLNQAQTPELRPPARPGEPFELHFPDLAGLIPVGTERIAGAGAIADPRVAPRHAVVERIGPDALLVQNLGEHQTFVVAPDGSHYPVGKYGFVIRSGQEIVMGGTRVRVTAEGRAPDPDAAGPFGYHPFRGHQSFSPNFANGPQEGFGARIHPESGIVPGVGRSYAVESLAADAPISVRENPADPNSPWRPLAPGERHRLRFEHGVSEEFRNAEGLVSRMTRHGEIVHVRGGEIALEVEAPSAPPIELALGERERFVIGTRPESDVALPPYGEANGRVLLDPYLHIPSSPDPRLRYAPDIPADHAEVYRTPEGEWRIRNLSGAVMEVTGRGENHFFLPRGGEMTLSDGQQIVFRGERPYRYRFRVPRGEAPAAPEPALPRAEVGRRTSAWLEAPDAAALNQRLAAEGVPLRVRAQEGPQDAEAAVRALAETPPTLLLRFENGRLTPDSVELLYAFAAMPEALRTQLRASARAFEGLFTDLALRENPLALHYLRESANIFHTRVFREGAPELAQALASLRPENVAEAQAALARLFFWGPENLGRESNLSLTGITGNDGFYMLADATPAEFPDPALRAQVQARVEAAREEGRRAQAEAELIRARIQEHFRNIEAPEAPALNEAGLRALVGEMVRNARAPEARPAAAPEAAAVPIDATIGDPPRPGRARFRPISEIAAEAERVSGGLRRGEDPNSERVRDRVARYRDHLIEQGLEAGEAQARAEAWRERVLGAARAHQARVTHIYDTSLPARPETAHLDAATVDHHGRFANERNATEQLLDRFEGALTRARADAAALEAARSDPEAMAAALEGTGRTRETATPQDVEIAAAIRALDLREVTTDNLADGGWSVWIARNQARVLRDPQLRALIEAATHFEDFTAFGTTYSEATPGVRLQAALFQGYGEILRRQGIRGSDRFSPLQAVEVMGEAMALIDGLLTDPARREAEAQEFFRRVEEARAIAAERGVIAEASAHVGDTRMTCFDLRALSDFTVFQQWLALPRVTGPDGAPDTLQVSVVPMPPARTASGGEAPRTLQIVAIPNGRSLPSGRGLLSALDRVNAAERERARELGVEPANVWFGKDNVILANPAGGGTLLRPAELAAILRDPALALFEAPARARDEAVTELASEDIQEVAPPRPAPPRAAPPPPPAALRPEARPARPAAAQPAEGPVLEARRRGRQAFRQLGEVLSAYSVRRSPELTAALQNLRETLRGGDARELAARIERARDIFSHPELRSLWEYAESLSQGEARGTAARDLLLAVLDGRVLDVDQARIFLRSSQPALRLERRMRDVARDLNEALRGAGLGDLADNPALAEQALRPLLRRLFSDPANPPSEGRLTRELLSLRDTLNLLRRELERQGDLDPDMRRQLLEGYLVELAAGRLDRQAALRLAAEGNAAMDAARREREAVIEVDERELLPADEVIEVEDADFLPEARPADEAVAAPEAREPLPETAPPPPPDTAVEILAAAELPGAVADFIRENFSRPEQREAQETLARQNLPALRDALEANGVDANTPEGRWILSRLLVDVVRGRVETPAGPSLREGGLNAESLQARIEAESTLYRSVETLGFEANSREGLRLAAFLYRRFVREARSAAEYQSRLALLAHSDLREASDRLVLLGEERSAAARERYLEWAIESGQTPESLQEVFWNALRGVTALSLTPNGLEIRAAEAGRSPLGEIGGRVAEVLDSLHIPPFSPEGTRLANTLLARAAVEARPGTPRFGRMRLEEAAARAEALPGELQPVLARVPRPSATGRAELLRWALQTGQNAESLARLGETLALLPETRAQALLRWIVASGQRPESLAALRETVEAALDAETPITDVAGIRRLHAARLEAARVRTAAGLPSVPRSSRAYETLERYAFTQGPDTMMFERRPDESGALRLGLSPGGNRRARLWNFADPAHAPGPIVNLARRAERALRRVYERAVEIERLEREAPADPRLAEARRELETARREVEAWENEGMAVYDASLAAERISEPHRDLFFRLRQAVEPDAETFDAENRPLEPNAVQRLRARILGIDGAEPDFFELADAWLDPARGDQGARPVETGRLTVVVREPADVATVARALEATVREARVFFDPEIRLVAEDDGGVRLECYERGDPNARQAIRVVAAETARRERAAETARVERNARETPAALPIPEIRPAAKERPAAAPAGEERRTQPARPGNRPAAGEAAAPRSEEGTQAATPSSRSAVRDVPAPPPAEAAPAAAQRPTLRVVKGSGTGRHATPEAAPPPPAAAETALAAGTDISVMAPLPDALDPLAPIRNAARSEAFVASLVALEEAGLIPAGTALEQYRLPGVVLRADRPGERVAVSLQPGRAESERVLYRVEAVENGVLRLRRIGGEIEADPHPELHVGPSHELIPFQANDYVFLRAAGPERPRPSRGPETPPPPPGGDDAELPARHAIHPELLEGAGRPFSIPPARLPDLDYAASRAELELRVVDEGPHAWVETTLPEIDAIADNFAARGDRLFPEYGPLAEAIRADLAVMRDPVAPLERLEPVTRRLAELLRLRREFPPTDPAFDNMFRDQAAALYERGLPPPPAAGHGARTVRPPRPGSGAANRTGAARPPGDGSAEAAHPSTEETVRVVPEMPRDDAPLLAEIDAMAGREVEGFSELARRTREALRQHAATEAGADETAARAWNEGRRRIIESYRRERLRLARELVARHEAPGRRVLEFLQGLGHDEALWGELEALGVERARVAADIPPHGRPKAVEDVLPKLERRGWNSLIPFTDLFGTRIVVESYSDALAVVAAIRHRFQVRPEYSPDGRLIFPSHRRVRRADGPERVHLNLLESNRPVLDQERVGRVLDGRRSGYRALHVVVDVDGMPVEIQIQTRSLYRWGHIQHEFYKNETLARPENRDLRETVDRYFAEAARYLAQAEQGVPAERPAPPELPAGRLAALPRESRSEIRVAVERMEALLDERPAAVAPPPTYRRAVSSLEVRSGRGASEHPLDSDWAAAFFPEGRAPTELAAEFALDADVDADQAAALWQSDFSDTLTRRLRESLGPRAASREPVAFRLRIRRENAVTEIFMIAEPRLLTEEGAMRRLLAGESFAEADFYHQTEILHPEGDTEVHLAQVHLAERLRGRGLYESFSRTLRADLARRHPGARVSAMTASPSMERIFLATYGEAESVPIEAGRPQDGLYLSGRLPEGRPEEVPHEAEMDLAAATERSDAAAEALREPEAPAPAAAPRRSAPPDPFDGGNLHASFLGAGLMMAMTSMGHSPSVSLLAGIFGTVLPVGILGVIRWVRGRLGSAPAAAPGVPVAPAAPPPVGPAAETAFADFTVTAEDGSEFVFRPYRAEPGAAPWRFIASVDRVLPASRPDHFEATFAVVRQAPGEPPAMVTVEIPARQARAMGLVNELGHTQRGVRVFLDRVPAAGAAEPISRETIPLEAAPPPEPAPPPSPAERPLLQPNVMGGNLAEIDGHLAGTTLDPAQLAEVLARHSRRVNLPGGELVYVATQGIDPKHPVGEDFMGGLEYRDAYGRRVYSMMVADGMGGMGNGDAAAQLSVEAFAAELRRSGDMRRAWELANAAVREFNRAFHEGRNREAAITAAREWIRDPGRARPGGGADGGGSCSVSFSVIPPSRPEGPYVLQTHFAGDASLRVYRRGPDGRYRRVYATVEQNVGAVAADSLQEGGADLRRTREIRLHPMANQVTNGVGSRERLTLAGTADGEIPAPNGRVRRAAGYEHGLVLQEGDLVLAGSDGFWENFIDTDVVGELIQEARSAEEAHRILREETHARMEVVRRLRARELPAAANGRFRFTHRGRELFIDRQYNVYDSEAATAPIDKFKPDNFSLAAYLHRPAAVAAENAAPTPVPHAPAAPAAPTRRSSVPPPIPEAARRPRPAAPADPMVARAQEIGLSLVGHVEGLTPELESRFFEGLTVEAVERPNLHYVATLSGRRGPATLEQYRIYCHWRERMALGTGGIETALAEVSRHPVRPAARAILADPRSAPVRRLQIGEFGMYLSRVIRVVEGDEGSRDYVLAVVPELRDGVMTLKRRFFYRSQSGGGWRASPFFGFGILQKGQPRFGNPGDPRGALDLRGARHYTAESEPLPEVLEALETLDREGSHVAMAPDEIFRVIGLGGADEGAEGDQRRAIVQSMMHGYGERTNYVEAVPIAHLQTESLQPGRVFHRGRNDRTVDRVLETMRDLDYPEGFVPDFAAEPRRSYRARHALLGEVTYREYGGSRLRTVGGRERELIWTVAEDGRRADGSTRVWVQSIRLADARPTSYGVPDQVLDTGILTSKPVEYASQAELLEGTPYVAELSNSPRDADGEARYVDITPALDVLAPIRAYRAARGLPLAPQAAKPGEAAPVRRPASVPPPIPAAARRPVVSPRSPAAVPNTPVAAPAGISGDLVIAGGEHLYRIARGGLRAGDRRYVYQLRLDSESGPEAPLFQEIESPRALNPAEIEAVLDGRRPTGVVVREGWQISDLRAEGTDAATGNGTLPLSLVPNTPGMRSVQVDFYVLPSERTPVDSPSDNPRASLVDPTLRGASGREPVLTLGGRSESGDPARREWILEVRQDRVAVLVDGQRVLPFQGFVRLSEGTRIRVGLSEFVFRGQALVPETTAPLRLSVPPQSRPAEGLPIAAAFERGDAGPVGEDGED